MRAYLSRKYVTTLLLLTPFLMAGDCDIDDFGGGGGGVINIIAGVIQLVLGIIELAD